MKSEGACLAERRPDRGSGNLVVGLLKLVTVFLVPVGHGRLELYSELPEESPEVSTGRAGWLRRWSRHVSVRWRAVVDAARKGKPRTRLVRWRDALICRLAETVAEQRTLWALRHQPTAVLRFPSTIEEGRARAGLMTLAAAARQHHLRWFVIDLTLFAASGVVFFVPGPNLIAYYFAFRFIGHLQSWRGARQALQRIAWQFVPDDDLAELASLVDVPRETRAPSVAAIAARLNLGRLSAFFDRVAERPT